MIAACSGPGEDDGSTSSATTDGTRWTLPSDVRVAGAKVRLDYDDAPKWTSSAACAGKLRSGGKILGEMLMDKFAAVSSVGGYACRRNTADSGRMSVHGTGRALDVFIPMLSGKANSAKGDKVANWLVKNAQNAGVQLVIWNRSMWRANGTNEALYGGPVPHVDHLHVELTNEAAAKTALWFTPVDDPGTDAGTTDTDSGTTDSDAGDTDTDAGDTDAGTTTPDASTPAPDAGPPAVDAGTDSGTTTPEVDAGTEPEPTPGTTETGDYGESSAEDEAGEENSLPDRPTRSVDDEEAQIIANAGCSTSRGTPSPLGTAGTSLAFAAVLGAWLRRRRR